MTRAWKLLAIASGLALATAVVDVGPAGVGAQAQPAGRSGAASPLDAVSIPTDDAGRPLAGWLSLDEIAADPALLPAPLAGKVAISSASSPVSPASHFGCNNDVCIDVQGEDLFVSLWGTQAFGNDGCQHAWFVGTDGTNYFGPLICPDPGTTGLYYDYTGPIGYYADDTDLCNFWDNTPGYPCATVHD